jgi:hypothetical protein
MASKPHFDHDEATRLYTIEKWTTTQLAARFCVSISSMSAMLRRRGVALRGNAHHLDGQRIGRLVVLGREGLSPRGAVLWRCRCDCGAEVVVCTMRLVRDKHRKRTCGAMVCRKAERAEKAT